MELFNTIKNLESKSTNILDVFTKTIKDLEKVNNEAANEVSKREALIKKAEEDKKLLEEIKTKNTVIITKISKIFE